MHDAVPDTTTPGEYQVVATEDGAKKVSYFFLKSVAERAPLFSIHSQENPPLNFQQAARAGLKWLEGKVEGSWGLRAVKLRYFRLEPVLWFYEVWFENSETKNLIPAFVLMDGSAAETRVTEKGAEVQGQTNLSGPWKASGESNYLDPTEVPLGTLIDRDGKRGSVHFVSRDVIQRAATFDLNSENFAFPSVRDLAQWSLKALKGRAVGPWRLHSLSFERKGNYWFYEIFYFNEKQECWDNVCLLTNGNVAQTRLVDFAEIEKKTGRVFRFYAPVKKQ